MQMRSVLWDKSHYRYKDRRSVEREWDEVAKNVGIPKEDAKKKWFNKELKKIPKSKSGAAQDQAAIYTGKWQHYKSLLFLKDTMTPRETDGNLSLVLEDSTIANVEANDADINFVETRPSSKTSPVRRKRKKTREDGNDVENRLLDIETKKLALLEASEDENSLFLRSLLPFMKKLDPIRQLRVRTKFQEILLQEMEPVQSQEIYVNSQAVSSAYYDISAPNSPIFSVYQQTVPNSCVVDLDSTSQYTFEQN